jgi:peptide/nickel transport system permease protein
MARYLIRRLAQALLVLWLLTVIVFGISRLSGSPVDLLVPIGAGPETRERLIDELGLDQPLPVQYAKFLGNAVQGDFGRSIRFQAPALELVLDRLPATLELAAAALVLAIVIGIPLGMLAALTYGRKGDYAVTAVLTVGQATPSFWLGILLILFLGVELRLLPIAGNRGFESLIMPAIALSVVPLVSIARLTRSSMIGVLRQDYVRTARAKGLRRPDVLARHVAPNGLIPVVTIIGISLAELVSGAVITEQIFSWPGIGRLAVESINARDFPVVQAVTLVASAGIVLASVLVDLVYFALDPRIRESR